MHTSWISSNKVGWYDVYNSREWHAVYGLEIIDDISAIRTDARLKMQ